MKLPRHRAFVTVVVAAVCGCGGPADESAVETDSVATVRSWREPIKRSDGGAQRRVNLLIDYGDGAVLEHSPVTRRPDRERSERHPPAPAGDELAAAETIAHQDPALRALLDAHGAQLAGGYPVWGEEGLAPGGARPSGGCGEGSRCIAFLALPPGGERPVADVVVDLVSHRVTVAELEAAR